MLALTRRDGSTVHLNPQLVVQVQEPQPDITLVVMLDGHSHSVVESPEEIRAAWVASNAEILALAASTPTWETLADQREEEGS